MNWDVVHWHAMCVCMYIHKYIYVLNWSSKHTSEVYPKSWQDIWRGSGMQNNELLCKLNMLLIIKKKKFKSWTHIQYIYILGTGKICVMLEYTAYFLTFRVIRQSGQEIQSVISGGILHLGLELKVIYPIFELF